MAYSKLVGSRVWHFVSLEHANKKWPDKAEVVIWALHRKRKMNMKRYARKRKYISHEDRRKGRNEGERERKKT